MPDVEDPDGQQRQRECAALGARSEEAPDHAAEGEECDERSGIGGVVHFDDEAIEHLDGIGAEEHEAKLAPGRVDEQIAGMLGVGPVEGGLHP